MFGPYGYPIQTQKFEIIISINICEKSGRDRRRESLISEGSDVLI